MCGEMCKACQEAVEGLLKNNKTNTVPTAWVSSRDADVDDGGH